MRPPLALLAIALACAGCPTTAPTALLPPVMVDPTKVRVGAPVEGVIKVSGSPGAVAGAPVTTVTLTIVRERAPAAWRLLHLAGGLAIDSTFARVAPDGGFAETTVGTRERQVRSGDELNVTPQDGIVQVGPTAVIDVP